MGRFVFLSSLPIDFIYYFVHNNLVNRSIFLYHATLTELEQITLRKQ